MCVIIQSTRHSEKKNDTSESKKPQAILDYNSTKGAVDTSDKRFRATQKTTKKN